jgi:hypothetical protein
MVSISQGVRSDPRFRAFLWAMAVAHLLVSLLSLDLMPPARFIAYLPLPGPIVTLVVIALVFWAAYWIIGAIRQGRVWAAVVLLVCLVLSLPSRVMWLVNWENLFDGPWVRSLYVLTVSMLVADIIIVAMVFFGGAPNTAAPRDPWDETAAF